LAIAVKDLSSHVFLHFHNRMIGVAATIAAPTIVKTLLVNYLWMGHPRYGWGWHHPQYGWHKGWDYVERPAYPMAGPGYVWMSHPRYGWGWRHPRHGWYRGWR
jgi:hypothetical protein